MSTKKHMTVEEASRIFHLMKHAGENSRAFRVPKGMKIPVLSEIEFYHAETFADFLLKNQIETYEEVIR